jgi:hypothetical protein
MRWSENSAAGIGAPPGLNNANALVLISVQVVGAHETRELKPCSAAGRLKHRDLGARVGNADYRVQELAFDGHLVLDFQAERDEERRYAVEVGDGDANVVRSAAWRRGRSGRPG